MSLKEETQNTHKQTKTPSQIRMDSVGRINGVCDKNRHDIGLGVRMSHNQDKLALEVIWTGQHISLDACPVGLLMHYHSYQEPWVRRKMILEQHVEG